ncbi:putative Germinal center kinase 1 [Blattamonas nauphoetae]|uniref:Germinal center kinase 1 n=1 Tax=Blattamonas nauphoetae TaxID=2049346 RepID=A0ABQ9X2B4_9EUKA|nr:putative Germinal center kinase 1 [Blattamonas nauphoetae]
MAAPLLQYDNFELLELAGEGSYGKVFKARERGSGDIYGVKIIDMEEAEDEIEDLQKEIAMLTECETDLVTKYYGSFVHGQSLWIVMEFLEGGSCLELRDQGSIDEAQISVILKETLRGLVYLHDQGKIHRDIKAANILISSEGDVKISDFGVSGQLSLTMAKRRTMVGTPFWMAPEVIQAKDNGGYDTKADLWSLGITAIELAKGKPPFFDIHPMKVLFLIPNNPPPTLEDDPDLGQKWTKEFKSFVSTCLVKDPSERPNARELLKHKFIKNAKKNSILVSLIERKRQLRAHHPSSRSKLQTPAVIRKQLKPDRKPSGPSIAESDKADVSKLPKWDFSDDDEDGSTDHPPSPAPNENEQTVLESETREEFQPGVYRDNEEDFYEEEYEEEEEDEMEYIRYLAMKKLEEIQKNREEEEKVRKEQEEPKTDDKDDVDSWDNDDEQDKEERKMDPIQLTENEEEEEEEDEDEQKMRMVEEFLVSETETKRRMSSYSIHLQNTPPQSKHAEIQTSPEVNHTHVQTDPIQHNPFSHSSTPIRHSDFPAGSPLSLPGYRASMSHLPKISTSSSGPVPSAPLSSPQSDARTPFKTSSSPTLPQVILRDRPKSIAIGDSPFSMVSTGAVASSPFTGTDDTILLTSFLLPSIRSAVQSTTDKKTKQALLQLENSFLHLSKTRMGVLSQVVTDLSGDIMRDLDQNHKFSIIQSEPILAPGQQPRIPLSQNIQNRIVHPTKLPLFPPKK